MGSQVCNTTADGFGECQCAAVTCASAGASRCGTHGSCQDTANGITCTCTTGYAGADCAACARGFQDNDGDGTCTASCASAPSCGAHGQCDDVSGSASCSCDEGYAGADCTTCATGFQDADSDGTCKPSCATAMIGCGLGGTCDDTSGTATCVCATNFAGATCARCADGFQDNDSNNTCESACLNISCNMHGSCADTTGRVVCTCNAGFGGVACAGCAPGFQDNDNNGTCTATCATAGLSCERRSSCVDTTGTASCQCVVGFSVGGLPDGGQGCVYSGGPADPGFNGTPANAWSTNPDAGWVFAPDAGGVNASSDGGLVTLPAALRRSFDATLSQTFVVAGAQARQGLRFNMLHSSSCTFNCFGEPPLLIQLNDTSWKLNAPLFNPAVYSTCLGEGALGNQSTLTFSGSPQANPTSNNFIIDRLWIDADDTCPAPGEVVNGRFSTTAGWTLQGPGTAIVAQAGVNGSGALRLLRPTRCDAASATGALSVPTANALPNAALRFKARGSSGRTLVMSLDGLDFDLETGLTPADHVVCLPDTMRGRVVPMVFQLISGGSGLCSDVDARFVEIDDVEVVSEPARCPAQLPFGDGSFESGVRPHGWFVPVSSCSASTCSPGNTAGGLVDAAQARTGSGVGRVSTQQRCVQNQLKTPAVVPVRNATGGPALRFFYRLPSLNTTQAGAGAAVVVDGTSTALPIATAWTPQIICLAPGQRVRNTEISFSVRGTSGLCSDIYPTPDQLFIDDLLVTNDPACP